MRARDILKRLKELKCVAVRQTESHVMMRCKTCQAPIPVHPSYEIKQWLAYQIEAELEPCLGKRWLMRK